MKSPYRFSESSRHAYGFGFLICWPVISKQYFYQCLGVKLFGTVWMRFHFWPLCWTLLILFSYSTHNNCFMIINWQKLLICRTLYQKQNFFANNEKKKKKEITYLALRNEFADDYLSTALWAESRNVYNWKLEWAHILIITNFFLLKYIHSESIWIVIYLLCFHLIFIFDFIFCY